MKIIRQKAELLTQEPGIEGIHKQIELCGRTCYKSEDKITEDSAKPFVDRMIASKHLAMLEHGTVYLKAKWNDDTHNHYMFCPYSKVTSDDNGLVYVTTNLRVLIENNWLDDLQYICEPTEYHERRYTFKFTTSISVTRELNRHKLLCAA